MKHTFAKDTTEITVDIPEGYYPVKEGITKLGDQALKFDNKECFFEPIIPGEYIDCYWLIIRPLPRTEYVLHREDAEIRIFIPPGWVVIKDKSIKEGDKGLYIDHASALFKPIRYPLHAYPFICTIRRNE